MSEGASSDPKKPGRGRPALPPKQQRQRLVAAARRVLLRNDVASAGVKEIVREAGMPSRSFDEHFRSKDELIVEVIAGASSDFFVRIAEVLQAEPAMGAQAIDALLAAYLETLMPVVALDQKRLGHATRLHVHVEAGGSRRCSTWRWRGSPTPTNRGSSERSPTARPSRCPRARATCS